MSDHVHMVAMSNRPADSPLAASLAARARERMTAVGITQKELAARVRLTENHLQAVLRLRVHASVNTWDRIMAATERTPE